MILLKEEYIKGLLVEPNKLPKEITFKNDLETKQKLVKGYIECAYLQNENDVVLIVNEEHKNLGMEWNRDIGYDIIGGSFLIVGDDYENGEFKSLTDAQILKYKIKFGKESIERTNRKLNAIKIEIALNRNRSYESER